MHVMRQRLAPGVQHGRRAQRFLFPVHDAGLRQRPRVARSADGAPALGVPVGGQRLRLHRQPGTGSGTVRPVRSSRLARHPRRVRPALQPAPRRPARDDGLPLGHRSGRVRHRHHVQDSRRLAGPLPESRPTRDHELQRRERDALPRQEGRSPLVRGRDRQRRETAPRGHPGRTSRQAELDQDVRQARCPPRRERHQQPSRVQGPQGHALPG